MEIYESRDKERLFYREDDVILKMLLHDEEMCSVGGNQDIKIKHSFIDFCPLIFQRKLDYVTLLEVDRKSTSSDTDTMKMTWLQITDICNDILNQDEDIEKKQVIKNIVDFIFERFSKIFFVLHNLLYIFFFIIPFVVQITIRGDIDNGSVIVAICMFFFIATQAYFFYLEIIEMEENIEEYFSNYWNNIDVPIFFICFAYFVIRMQNLEKNYYPMSAVPSLNDDNYVVMIILNVIITMFGILKVMYFFRSNDDFGQFV